MRKAKENKQGYVMLLAVVIIAVLLMLSLMLLTVSYSLYYTSARQHDSMEVRELAYSLSEQIGQELETTFETEAELNQAEEAGEHPLWFLIYHNVNKDEPALPWPYHNEEEWRHKVANSYKYFTLSDIDNANVDADDVKIRMSWESDQDVVKDSDNDLVRMYDNGGFEVEVTVTVGRETCTVLSKYDLTVVDAGEDYKKWMWKLVDRE